MMNGMVSHVLFFSPDWSETFSFFNELKIEA
jgi:hypothetical protein